MKDTKTYFPLRAMTHPLWLFSLSLLLLNDHVFKNAFGSMWTGKLSDFVGLIVAPVLFAGFLQVRTRRGLWLSGLVVAIIFSAINLSTGLASIFDAAVSMVWPFHTTTDPTDLIALIAIPVALYVFEPCLVAPISQPKKIVGYGLAIAGGVASIASGPTPCGGGGDCWEPTETAQVSVLNKTNELHVLRVRPLRNDIDIDCDTVRSAPNTYLAGDAFGPAVTWFVQSGQEIPLQTGTFDEFGFPINDPGVTPCSVVMIESDTVPDTIVFWDDSLQSKTFQFDADIPKEVPADPQTVVLEADYSLVDKKEVKSWRNRTECGSRADLCSQDVLAPAAEIPAGARYSWSSQFGEQLHFNRPATLDPGVTEPAPGCETPDAGDGIAWEEPRIGTLLIQTIEEGPDGCHEVRLSTSQEIGEEFSWWLCAPIAAVSQLAPTTERPGVEIEIENVNASPTFTDRGHEGISIRAIYYDNDDQFAEVKTFFFVRGYSVPAAVEFSFQSVIREGCAPQTESCGSVTLPVDLRIPDATESDSTIAPGESLAFGSVVRREVYLVRAVFRAVIDATCESSMLSTSDGPRTYLETVIISE